MAQQSQLTVKATLEEKDRVRLNFPYSYELVQKVKEVPGREYDLATMTWTIPAIHYRKFRQVNPRIQVEAESAEDKKALDELANFTYAPVALRPADNFIGELYPFQAESVGFLLARKKALLSEEMGLGKTVSTIAAAQVLRNQGKIRKVLVFCPKTILTQWVNEYRCFTGDNAVVITGDAVQRKLALARAEQPQAFLVITNYETVLKDASSLAALKPDLVVLDESQRIGGWKNQTTRLIKANFKTPYRFCLTGTPLMNRLAELHSIMDWIEPNILGPWWAFKIDHVIYGGYKNKEVVGSKNLPLLHEKIKDWMIRHRKEDVLKDLPDVTVNNYAIELDSDERNLYSTFKRKLQGHYEKFKQSRGQLESGEILASLVYLREICDHTALVSNILKKSSKLDELHRILSDLGDQKVVVFSEFARMIKLIAQSLDVNYVCLSGDMAQQERINSINTFMNNPECKVFLSTEAGGVGVNLQAASVIINYDLPWNPSKVQQRIGRLHRIGQKDTVTCINLVTKATIEEHVLEVLSEKTDLFRKVVDGDFSDQAYENSIWKILDAEFKNSPMLPDDTERVFRSENKTATGMERWF
jgi:SNF2 family DNA or RNA helicase